MPMIYASSTGAQGGNTYIISSSPEDSPYLYNESGEAVAIVERIEREFQHCSLPGQDSVREVFTKETGLRGQVRFIAPVEIFGRMYMQGQIDGLRAECRSLQKRLDLSLQECETLRRRARLLTQWRDKLLAANLAREQSVQRAAKLVLACLAAAPLVAAAGWLYARELPPLATAWGHVPTASTWFAWALLAFLALSLTLAGSVVSRRYPDRVFLWSLRLLDGLIAPHMRDQVRFLRGVA